MSTWIEYIIKPVEGMENGLTVNRDPFERKPEIELEVSAPEDSNGEVEFESVSVYLDYTKAEALRDQLNQYLGHNDPNQEDDDGRRVANVGVYLKSLSTEGEQF